MPFYEYLGSNSKCKTCSKVFEVMQPITADALTSCPDCGQPVTKQLSLFGGVVFLHREMSQYNDVLKSKYWRDKNGDLHRVTPSDGDIRASGVGRRQKASPQEVENKKKRDEKIRKYKRREQSYQRFLKRAKRSKQR